MYTRVETPTEANASPETIGVTPAGRGYPARPRATSPTAKPVLAVPPMARWANPRAGTRSALNPGARPSPQAVAFCAWFIEGLVWFLPKRMSKLMNVVTDLGPTHGRLISPHLKERLVDLAYLFPPMPGQHCGTRFLVEGKSTADRRAAKQVAGYSLLYWFIDLLQIEGPDPITRPTFAMILHNGKEPCDDMGQGATGFGIEYQHQGQYCPFQCHVEYLGRRKYHQLGPTPQARVFFGAMKGHINGAQAVTEFLDDLLRELPLDEEWFVDLILCYILDAWGGHANLKVLTAAMLRAKPKIGGTVMGAFEARMTAKGRAEGKSEGLPRAWKRAWKRA